MPLAVSTSWKAPALDCRYLVRMSAFPAEPDRAAPRVAAPSLGAPEDEPQILTVRVRLRRSGA